MAKPNRVRCVSVAEVKDAILATFSENVDVFELKKLGKGNVAELTIEACLTVCEKLSETQREQHKFLNEHIQCVMTAFQGPTRRNAVVRQKTDESPSTACSTGGSAKSELTTQVEKLKGYYKVMTPEVKKRLREYPGRQEMQGTVRVTSFSNPS